MAGSRAETTPDSSMAAKILLIVLFLTQLGQPLASQWKPIIEQRRPACAPRSILHKPVTGAILRFLYTPC
jgi:hypothetical protein